MQRLAMSWLVYRLTNSAFWLGVVGFANLFSSFIFMPWAGVLLDSADLKKVLVFAQFMGFV